MSAKLPALPARWRVPAAFAAVYLAEDLQIWATEEFGFVELADAHCRTSVIMPNKKNPYALAFIRGKARELTGSLVSVVATKQTPSGQIDNRNTSYDLLPHALATAGDLARLLSDVLARAVFDTERLRVQAGAGFTFATELTDLLMQREGIDSRTAHEIVGRVVARQARAKARGWKVEEKFAEAIFRSMVGKSMDEKG